MYDLTRPFEGDAALQILTPKDAAALPVYRHSTAHLLAAAVLELFPETKLGIGPPIENGFYYDFDRRHAFHARRPGEDREEHVGDPGARSPYERVYTRKEEGLRKYADAWMKRELIEERAGEIFSEYTLGPHFIDFCRGPHVPRTSKIKAFKLLSIAGAYWKGDEKNKQLQRIYGTAFFTKKELDEYLQPARGSQEARPPQAGQGAGTIHRQRAGGRRLAVLAAQGRHHPPPAGRLYPGAGTRQPATSTFIRRDLAKVELYSAPATGSTITRDMFPPMDLETEQMVLRPMNCPHHILVYESKRRSYRDLPVRIARVGHHVPLRTLRRVERVEPRTRHDTERRAYFLHARTRSKRNSREVNAVGRAGYGTGHYAVPLPASLGDGQQREIRR